MPVATDTPTLLSQEELAAWAGFLRVHAAVTRELDAELSVAHSLPLSSYEVLVFLHSAPNGMMRMSELAQDDRQRNSLMGHLDRVRVT